MRGIIVNINIDDPVRVWVRTNDNIKRLEKFFFKPIIYLEKRELERAKTFLTSPTVEEVFQEKKTVNPRGDKKELIGVKLSGFQPYFALKHFLENLNIAAYNIDIFPEQLFLQAPALVESDIKINHGIHGNPIDPATPEPPPIKLAFLKQENNNIAIETEDETITINAKEKQALTRTIKTLNIDMIVHDDHLPKHLIVQVKKENLDKLFVPKSKFPGLAALSEKALFTFTSPKRVVELTIGNSVDARQVHFALKKNWAIPMKENNVVFLEPASFYYSIDKGPIMITPRGSVFENVAAIDFTSMFPNIIMKYNLSYETCTPKQVKRDNVGFLPEILKTPLERRLAFKKLKEKNPHAEERYKMLKLLLVAIYGFSGKLDNRFGNPLCNMYINYYARIEMENAIKTAKKQEFKVVYSDTDSLFVTKQNMNIEEVNELIQKIRNATSLPVSLQDYFRVIVFTKTSNAKRRVLKRYYGLTREGNIVIKGITSVRTDTPPLIKKAQIEAIETTLTLLEKNTPWKIPEKISEIYNKYFEMIKEGQVKLSELIIKKKLRKDPSEYRTNQPHVIIAKHIKQATKEDEIEYIYTGSRNKNPHERATTPNRAKYYDKIKYLEMLKKAINEIYEPIKEIIEENATKTILSKVG